MIDRQHAAQYILLILIFAIGIFIFMVSPDPLTRKVSMISLAFLYPIWGIFHHWEHGHLTKPIITEYALVGLLVLVALLGILN